MLYYRGKSRAIDSNVEASMYLLAPIEIVQFNQNRFDIITFIEFADALTNDYICCYFSNTYYQIEIFALNAYLQGNSVSFIMKINMNYSDFKVSIQDAIHVMTIVKKDDVPCIILQTNSIQPNQFNLFTNTDYDEVEKHLIILKKNMIRKNTHLLKIIMVKKRRKKMIQLKID